VISFQHCMALLFGTYGRKARRPLSLRSWRRWLRYGTGGKVRYQVSLEEGRPLETVDVELHHLGTHRYLPVLLATSLAQSVLIVRGGVGLPLQRPNDTRPLWD
jgi:hypothetical protein